MRAGDPGSSSPDAPATREWSDPGPAFRGGSALEQFGEVAGTLAREMGAPLTAIEVTVDRLRRRCRKLGDEEADQELQRILEQSDRLSRLARTLLALARPDRPSPRSLDANRAVRAALDLVQPDLERAGIETEMELARPAPRLRADPHQLRAALLALFLNARQALESGDGPRRILVDTGTGSDRRVRIRIRDTGPGIPSGEEERIFLPFVSGWGGDGVGLSLSRLALLGQGGELLTERPEKGGAAFVLLLEPAKARKGTDP